MQATPPATQETVYLDEGGVKITSARAILGDKTYAMSNVTSVSTQTVPAGSGPLIPILIGVILGACGLAMGGDSLRWGFFLIGGLFVVLGIVATARARPTYAVRIGSASGEANALTANNKQYIERIVTAMNEAIIRRG